MGALGVEYFGVPPPERLEKEARFRYIATASQTAFVAYYTLGYVDVYKNGLKLDPVTAFTATDGVNVNLTVGATAGDTIQIICRKQIPDIDSYSVAQANATFALISNTYTQSQTYSRAQTNAIITPVGGIIIWSGSIASLSALAPNWYLCDGTNGTIDLRDKFIVGAGNSYAVAATGGATTHTLVAANLPPHGHVVNINTGIESNTHYHNGATDPDGYHQHTYHGNVDSNQFPYAAGGGIAGIGIPYASGAFTDPGGTHQHTYSTSTQTTPHTHNVSGTTGNGPGTSTAVTHLPPYYPLAYIQRVL